MIYVFIRAPYDLDPSFVTPYYFAAMREDFDCHKVFENTASNTISIFEKNVKKPGKLDNTDHYGLMAELSGVLPENCTLVLPDVTTLSTDQGEAFALAERFLDRHIILEFVDSPWMNTKNMAVLFKITPYEAKAAFHSNLIRTIEWKTKADKIPADPDPKICQASREIKKNSI